MADAVAVGDAHLAQSVHAGAGGGRNLADAAGAGEPVLAVDVVGAGSAHIDGHDAGAGPAVARGALAVQPRRANRVRPRLIVENAEGVREHGSPAAANEVQPSMPMMGKYPHRQGTQMPATQ